MNDKEVANYEHRLSPSMVRGLEVDGDVSLQRVQMINFPQRNFFCNLFRSLGKDEISLGINV